MRSIGKRNIGRVQRLIQEELAHIDKGQFGWVNELERRVIDRIPAEIFDTWEMARQEIERIIDDYVNK